MKKQTTQVLFMLLGLLIVSKAQVKTDSIYSAAITHANNQQYNLAINEAKNVLSYYPGQGNILVFIAKVYSWDKLLQ